MRGEHRPTTLGAAAAQDMTGELHVRINIPGVNRAASQDLFWPSRIGRCGGHPHSYVCMPFGLPGMAVAFQRCMRDARAAREARHPVILVEYDGFTNQKRPSVELIKDATFSSNIQAPE